MEKRTTTTRQRPSTAPARRSVMPARSAPAAAVKDVRGRFKFVQDVYSELKKVSWPTREEALRLSAIVIAVSTAVGLFLGGVDYLFYFIINQVILGR